MPPIIRILTRKHCALVAEHDALVAERDALISQRDALVAERDALVAERDALVAERNALVAERDALISQRDQHPTFGAALRAARRWLNLEVHGIAEAAIRAVNDPKRPRNEYGPHSFLIGHIAKEIDPYHHPYCRAHAMANMVLACSKNADAHDKEFGANAYASLATRAAAAMRSDTWELLEARVNEWL